MLRQRLVMSSPIDEVSHDKGKQDEEAANEDLVFLSNLMTKIYSREYFSQTPPHFAWLRLDGSENDTNHIHRRHSLVNNQDARAAFKDARMRYLGNVKAGKKGRGAAEILPKGVDTFSYRKEKRQAEQEYTRDLRKLHHDWAYAIRHAMNQKRAPWMVPANSVNKSLLGWWDDTDVNETKKEDESRQARDLLTESQTMDSGGALLENEDTAEVASRASSSDRNYKAQTTPYSQPQDHAPGSHGFFSGRSPLERSSASNPALHNAQFQPHNFAEADVRRSFKFASTPSQGSINLHQLYQELPAKPGPQIPHSVQARQTHGYLPPQSQGHPINANIQQRPPGFPTQPHRSPESVNGNNSSTEIDGAEYGVETYQPYQRDQRSYQDQSSTVYPASYPQGNVHQGTLPQSVPADKVYEHLLSDHHNLQRQRRSPIYAHQPMNPVKLGEGRGAETLYPRVTSMHQASERYHSQMPSPFSIDQSLDELQSGLGYQPESRQAYSTPQGNFINSQHELVYDENTGQMHPLRMEFDGKSQASVPAPVSVDQYHSFHVHEEIDSPYRPQQLLSPAKHLPTPQGNSAPPQFYYKDNSDLLPGTPVRSPSINSEWSHRDGSQSNIRPVDAHMTNSDNQFAHTSVPQQTWDSRPLAHQYRASQTRSFPHQHGIMDAHEGAMSPGGVPLNGSFPVPMPYQPSVGSLDVAHTRPNSVSPHSPLRDVRGPNQMEHGASPERRSPQSARNTPFDDPVLKNEPLAIPKQRDPATHFRRELMGDSPLREPMEGGGQFAVHEGTTSPQKRDQVSSFQLKNYKKGHLHPLESNGTFSSPASPLRTPGASPYRERDVVSEVDRTFTLGGHEGTSSSSQGEENDIQQEQLEQQPRGWRLRVEGSDVDVIGRWRLRMKEGIVEAADMIGHNISKGGTDGAGKLTDKQEKLKELEMLIKLVDQDVDLPPSPSGERTPHVQESGRRVSSQELEQNLQQIKEAIAEVIDAEE